MTDHPVVSREQWIEARKELMAAEKELTGLRDRVSEQRRSLPWLEVEKDYVFVGPDGEVSLADLFDGRSQLIVEQIGDVHEAGRREDLDPVSETHPTA